MTGNRATEKLRELRELLDERGVEYKVDERNAIIEWSTHYGAFVFFARQREGKLLVETTVATEHSVILTPEQAVAVTLGRPRAKSHPYGYERDTGCYDCTRCECGCINDISARYCNDCGGEIEVDESADKEYYDGYSKHTVFAKKHDDGSLEFCERRYVPEDAATPVNERERRLELLVNQLWYLVNHRSGYGYAAALEAIEELGIEVDE